MDIIFSIDAVHSPCVIENEDDKNQYRSLLRKPEAELKATESNAVQLVDQKNAEAKTANEPDGQADRHQAQIGTPICHAVLPFHENVRHVISQADNVPEQRRCWRSAGNRRTALLHATRKSRPQKKRLLAKPLL